MTNEELADALITRLNELVKDPAVRADVRALIASRVFVSRATAEHPAIQVSNEPCELGVLGLLNGLCGTIPDGPKKGWGFIAAYYDDVGELVRFGRIEETSR